MALVENTLFGVKDKVQIAIDRLKAFEPRCAEKLFNQWVNFK